MRLLYVTTTFPVYSETFLQREVLALRDRGIDLAVLSLHGGDANYEGLAIDRFRKVELFRLLWLLPSFFLFRNRLAKTILAAMMGRRPPNQLNFWENMLGFGAAIARARSVGRERFDAVHCVWASAPASFGWMVSALASTRFSMGAHAYDVFEDGGDWLLVEKATAAFFVHCSTAAALEAVSQVAPGCRPVLIQRGLLSFPDLKPLRPSRTPLRILCIARLVEKKGLPLQMQIYKRMSAAGFLFEARIVGDGPLRRLIEKEIEALGLSRNVALLGRVSEADVFRQLSWADALFHTGIVTARGDRDGLPNAIPEAMAAGVVVVSSLVSGASEAVRNDVTGISLDPRLPQDWLAAAQTIVADDERCESIRRLARNWALEHYDGRRNAARLAEELQKLVRSGGQVAVRA